MNKQISIGNGSGRFEFSIGFEQIKWSTRQIFKEKKELNVVLTCGLGHSNSIQYANQRLNNANNTIARIIQM